MGKISVKFTEKPKTGFRMLRGTFWDHHDRFFCFKAKQKKIAAKPGLLCRVLARGQKTVMPAAGSPCVAPAQPF